MTGGDVPAFLVVHAMALFNDEWFDDLTDVLEIANPAGLYRTRADADAAVRAWTRAAVRGASWNDLLLGEEGTAALHGHDGPLPDPLPASLTDLETDDLIERLQVQLFHVLETTLPHEEFLDAHRTLTGTPERPTAVPGYDDHGEAVFPELDDPAAARLNRVTGLFGRRYGTDPGF